MTTVTEVLIATRKIVCDACDVGFNPQDGDWADRYVAQRHL